jgi:hypothetical protein
VWLAEQVARNTDELANSGERMEAMTASMLHRTRVVAGLTAISGIAAIVAVAVTATSP